MIRLYKFFICLLMAILAYPLLMNLFYDRPVPQFPAILGGTLAVVFLFERLYITTRVQYMVKGNKNAVDKPD